MDGGREAVANLQRAKTRKVREETKEKKGRAKERGAGQPNTGWPAHMLCALNFWLRRIMWFTV